ncbi:MAG: DUF1987 domain-containing protein [Bacteroidetes bacterium]|nr:MAG: DUF1987 domain-containing protein [Bacteroidota bacterium]
MENIHIEKTSKTPEVTFDFENHYLEIKGVSIPEDSENFYRPLMDAITEYVLHLTHINPAEAHTEASTATEGEEGKEEPNKDEATEITSPAPFDMPDRVLVSLKLIYFNTSTADYLVNLLRKLRELQPDYPAILDNGAFNPDEAPSHLVTVEWCYEIEDDDMYDTGTHFESVLEMPFTYVAVDEIV